MNAMWSHRWIPWLILVASALAALGMPGRSHCATLVETLQPPTGAEEVRHLRLAGDLLLVGARHSEGGLHCYDTATHQRRWTLDLGELLGSTKCEGIEVIVLPSIGALALDGSKLYITTSDRLIELDANTGQVIQSAKLRGWPQEVFPVTMYGHEVVVTVTSSDMCVHDAQELRTVHWLDRPAGGVCCAAFDDSAGTLFIVTREPDEIVKYTFDWSGPRLTRSTTSAACGPRPFGCELVECGLVAVACTGDAAVWTYDRTTLSHVSTYVGLTRLADIGYYDGQLVLVGIDVPTRVGACRGAVETLDPVTGLRHTVYFGGSDPTRVVPAPWPNACCVVDVGREEWELVPEIGGGWTSEHIWVDGHLWTFDVQTLELIDTMPLAGVYPYCVSGGSRNLVYLISPDGTAINAYSIP